MVTVLLLCESSLIFDLKRGEKSNLFLERTKLLEKKKNVTQLLSIISLLNGGVGACHHKQDTKKTKSKFDKNVPKGLQK